MSYEAQSEARNFHSRVLILTSFHFTPQLFLSNIIPGGGGGAVIVPLDPQEIMDQFAYPSPNFWL